MSGCKYYGKHWAGTDFGLVDSGGNQCAVITRAYAPCRMEIAGAAPDETACALAIAGPNGGAEEPSRVGEKVRIRMPRSEWINGRIEISATAGFAYLISTEKPLVPGRPISDVHPQLGCVVMPVLVSPDRGHGRPPVWKDSVTGVFCEIEFTGEIEDPLPPELHPRRIVSRTADGDRGQGERAELACGHTIISVVGPVGEDFPCPECVIAFLEKRKRANRA